MTQAPSRRPPLGAGAALAMSALGGIVLSWAFPALDWWWLAPVGIAGLLVPLIGRSGTGALAVGLVGGLTYFGALVVWASLFLGPVPYAALVVVMATYVALGAVLIARAYDWLPRRWPGAVGRFVALPAAVAGLWTLREAISGNWPYGGFAWGRVAQTQSASPFGDLVAWVGTSGLSFLVVALTTVAIEAFRAAVERRGDPIANLPTRIPAGVPAARVPAGVAAARAPAAQVPAALAPAARVPATRIPSMDARGGLPGQRLAGAVAAASAVALLAALPAFPVAATDTLRVGAVQGDTPEAGYFLRGEPGDVVEAHLEATGLIDPAMDVDVLLWPEGSVDLSPLHNPRVAFELSRLSAEYGAPLVANTVTVERGATEDDDQYYNTQFVWTAEGWADSTVDKQHPVPFGEYIPDRDFWYALAPDLVGLIQRGYSPGEGPAVLEVAGVAAGSFICFDIVDDGVIHDAVASGAQVLFAPTNNADFGATSELPQQLAFARLRAMETGRAIVQVSTVGDSAVYAPDGRELAALPSYVPGVMVVDVPLSDTITPAVAAGRGVEWFVAGAGIVLLVGARIGARLPRRSDGNWAPIRGS